MECFMCVVFVLHDHCMPYRGSSVCNGVLHVRGLCSLWSLFKFHIMDPLYVMECFMCVVFVLHDHCLSSLSWVLYMGCNVSCARSLSSVIIIFHIVDPLYGMECFMCEVFVLHDHCIPYRGSSVCHGVFHVRALCSLWSLHSISWILYIEWSISCARSLLSLIIVWIPYHGTCMYVVELLMFEMFVLRSDNCMNSLSCILCMDWSVSCAKSLFSIIILCKFTNYIFIYSISWILCM